MKIRMTSLIILLVLLVASCQRPAPVLKPKTFKLPRTEEQMLGWLKERSCEVEKIGENRYSISWKEKLPDGQITRITEGSGEICDVLIESTNGKNIVYFTFSLSLGVSIDVIALSECELFKAAGARQAEEAIHPQIYLPMSRYKYYVKNLQTSDKPITGFQVYFSRDLITRLGDIDVDHSSEELLSFIRSERSENLTKQIIGYASGQFLTGITGSRSGEFVLKAREYKSFRWSGKDLDISRVDFPVRFRLQFRSIPGIITARVDVDGLSRKSSLVLKKDGKTFKMDDAKEFVTQKVIYIDDANEDSINSFSNDILVTIEGQDINVSSAEMVEEILLQSCPQGKVIGPEAIPADWGVSELAQRLNTLTSQSVEEGWLDESAARQLKKHLANSQSALQKGQQRQAKQADSKIC